MTLSQLLRDCSIEPDAQLGDATLNGVVENSRKVQPGSLFVCMPGLSQDTHAFIADAASRGASAVLAHGRAGLDAAREAGVACAVVYDQGTRFSEAVWKIAKMLLGNPSARLRVVGVTGTNGKTTTAWLLRDALESLGRRSAYLGTLGYKGLAWDEGANTTPFAVELTNILSRAVEEGMTDLAMEVSSHALAEHRADGVEFDVGVLTNFTQDHLDFHGDLDAYEAAKQRLFVDVPKRSGKAFTAVINADDAAGERLLSKLSGPVISFGLNRGALRIYPDSLAADRMSVRLSYEGRESACQVPLGGSFNLYNVGAVAASLLALGYDVDEIAGALPSVTPAPGRFEPIANDRGFGVLVDYAHTPDALDKVLQAARALRPARLTLVFGCGGDRDRTKRPIMGSIAAERADAVYLTSDNPRTEDASAIIDDIRVGIPSGSSVYVELDRREAIKNALGAAQEGDIVVIAGKGHEGYQIIGREKIPMDDRQIAREALAS